MAASKRCGGMAGIWIAKHDIGKWHQDEQTSRRLDERVGTPNYELGIPRRTWVHSTGRPWYDE